MNSAKKKTGRPKAALAVDQPFNTRITKGERIAVEELIQRWRSERSQSSGGLAAPGDGPGLWFRTVLRGLCAEQGIAIVEPEPPPPSSRSKTATTKTTAKKTSAKR